MKTLIALLTLVLLLGCASSEMTSTRTADGTVTEYRVEIHTFGQDFAGSDLAASLDPEGLTTVSAGAIDNTTSQVTADVAASMVEMLKLMLPYIATPVSVAP